MSCWWSSFNLFTCGMSFLDYFIWFFCDYYFLVALKLTYANIRSVWLCSENAEPVRRIFGIELVSRYQHFISNFSKLKTTRTGELFGGDVGCIAKKVVRKAQKLRQFIHSNATSRTKSTIYMKDWDMLVR